MTVRSIIIREEENNMYRLRLRIRLKRKELKCISKHYTLVRRNQQIHILG